MTDPPEPAGLRTLRRLGVIFTRLALLSGALLLAAVALDVLVLAAAGCFLLAGGGWMLIVQGLLPMNTGRWRLWIIPGAHSTDIPRPITRLVAGGHILIGGLAVFIGVAILLVALTGS